MSTELTPAKRRSVLIATLRDRSMWPAHFEWAYDNCKSCAMGMYLQIMNIEQPVSTAQYRDIMASALGMSWRQVENVFENPAWPANELDISAMQKALRAVTPEMVADRLEQIHRTLL